MLADTQGRRVPELHAGELSDALGKGGVHDVDVDADDLAAGDAYAAIGP